MINKFKPKIKDKTVMDQLHLYDNEVLGKVPELKKKLHSMINEYQEEFTNDQCHVDNMTWDTFNIKLMPGTKPVRRITFV